MAERRAAMAEAALRRESDAGIGGAANAGGGADKDGTADSDAQTAAYSAAAFCAGPVKAAFTEEDSCPAKRKLW